MISQNGYTVRELPSQCRVWNIPGTKTRVRLANNWAGFLLVHLAAWYNKHIEPVDGRVLDDWGWAVRPIRGQTSGYSNHASGTAIDINATSYPRGVRRMSAIKRARINLRLRVAYRGLIRWGGMYVNAPVDEMHFEIVGRYADVVRLARRAAGFGWGREVLKANPDYAAAAKGTKSPYLSRFLKLGSSGTAVKSLQRVLSVKIDGDFGPVTEAAVKEWQRSHHLTADGVVGKRTAETFGWRWTGPGA